MLRSQTVDCWLASMLPTEVAWFCSENPAIAAPLLEAETQYTVQMVPRRLRSFRHGRHCARIALQKLGLPEAPVPVSAGRAPIWPEGIVGSISHTGDIACAVATRSDRLDGIGLDLEQTGRLDDGVSALVCTPSERNFLRSLNLENGERLLFTIKESVYKCLWPRLQRFIDFQEVEIELDPGECSFHARSSVAGDIAALSELRGRYGYSSELLCAVSYLPPTESDRT